MYEYIMDFKAEAKKNSSTVFEIEDLDSSSSTISASEASTPTPPLLCRLRKARVRIKKLPKHILDKYDLETEKSSQCFSAQPSRVSKRIGCKSAPGHYMSLHKNKPLNKIVNKKKYDKDFQKSKKIELNTQKSALPYKKDLRASAKANSALGKNQNSSSLLNSGQKFKSSYQNIILQKKNVDSRKANRVSPLTNSLARSLPNIPSNNIDSNRDKFLNSRLHEKIINTRKIIPDYQLNEVTSTTLPNCPDVLITRYELPPSTTLTVSGNREAPSFILPCVQNSSYNNTAHSNFSNNTKINKFAIISSSNRLNQISFQPPVINSAINITREQQLQQQLANNKQTITQPPRISKNGAIIVNSPKVLTIKQPVLTNDPLDVPQMESAIIKPSDDQGEYPINDDDIESITDSETEIDLSEMEIRPEPEVIKRIIYHTKAAQTKFTCPSNICGLIDSDEFNLNCFYCYDIFPLHKWLEFKNHVKNIHRVEEKSIISDAEEELSSEDLETQHTPKTTNSATRSPQGEKSIQTLDSNTKDLNKKKDILKIMTDDFGTKTIEEILKKLPVQPKLVTQNLGKIDTHEDAKENNSKKLKLLQNSNKSSHSIDALINTGSRESDSDDGVVDINEEIDKIIDDDVTENVSMKVEKKTEITNNNLKKVKCGAGVGDVVKLIPPQITVKKLVPIVKKSQIVTPAPERKTSKEKFIKLPPNFNIQNLIRTIRKPTTQQLTANGGSRPRYFVVKKILKPATTDKKPNVNISKGTIITKMSELPKNNYSTNVDYDDMPSNDENEDDVPKPTKGRGIIFGLTNRMVVIEFLLKLKTFPELWRPQIKNSSRLQYDQSINKMCEHLNHRFELNMQDFEMRQSIQRVKDWYCRMLNNIYEHNKRCRNTDPYQHKFPLYFKVLNQFLTSDVNGNKNLSNILKSDTIRNECKQLMTTKSKNSPKKSNVETSTSATTAAPTTLEKSDKKDENNSMESLIEFDADTLYELESSDDEILEAFDETKKSNEKRNKINKPKQQRSKHYVGHYECDICQKICNRICDLKRHKILHYPPQFECGVCTQKYYFKCWAEKCNHIKKKQIKIRNEKIVAESPPSPSSQPKIVRQIPLNPLPDNAKKVKRVWPKKVFRYKFICEVCGVSYRSIGSLNSHKRDKHLNQRLKCVVCNFTALTNYRIVQHQKKRHVVEPGTVEEVAKRSRARMDTKTRFSTEARQEFDWRREMRAKLKPGEIFYGCCKCRIIFNSRKEKVLHNKMEHPIKETTVVCLLCLPNKMLLSNSNCARRHYTDMHKVPWDEIDALVKRTKPIFNVLSKEEIELLNASENYKELLEELLKDRDLEPKTFKVEIQEDEALKAVQNLTNLNNIQEQEEELNVVYTQKVEEEQEQNVFIDGIIDHDYIIEEEYPNTEHNYSEEQLDNENINYYSENGNNENAAHLAYTLECNEEYITTEEQPNEHTYFQSVGDSVEGEFVEGDLVEESIIVEECVDDIVVEEEEEYF